METGKPQISILMAVYEPRMDWLREQLLSLDAQTYPNLKLYIRDDCSPTVSFEAVQSCVQDCIRAFPYEIQRNETNLGSNKTFELLTKEADGDYFAYCDQDDVWLPEKLEILEKAMKETGAQLVCSDMYVVDGEGTLQADSITQVRRHHRFFSGTGLAEGLIVSNFVTGCTMLIQRQTAATAVPFCPYMVHDHYLAFRAAQQGVIVSLETPLIRYRIHGNNQTLDMAGVHDKDSYLTARIEHMINRLQWLREHNEGNAELISGLSEMLCWANARRDNFHGSWAAKRTLWSYRRFSPLTSVFEIVMAGVPEKLFMLPIKLKRKNVL